jgi:hypothetical protein
MALVISKQQKRKVETISSNVVSPDIFCYEAANSQHLVL